MLSPKKQEKLITQEDSCKKLLSNVAHSLSVFVDAAVEEPGLKRFSVSSPVQRSISAKIQRSILHCTLHNLSYILCLSFEFTLAIQRFCIQLSSLIYATFKFSLSTFNFSLSNSQVLEFDLQVQWNVHSSFWCSRVGRETPGWSGLGRPSPLPKPDVDNRQNMADLQDAAGLRGR